MPHWRLCSKCPWLKKCQWWKCKNAYVGTGYSCAACNARALGRIGPAKPCQSRSERCGRTACECRKPGPQPLHNLTLIIWYLPIASRSAQKETWRPWPARVLLPGLEWWMCSFFPYVTCANDQNQRYKMTIGFQNFRNFMEANLAQNLGGCVWLLEVINLILSMRFFWKIVVPPEGPDDFLLDFHIKMCQVLSDAARSKSNSSLLMRWLQCWHASKTCKRSK